MRASLLLFALLALVARAAEITPPRTGHMPTPWTADASAGRAWQEYPRPQLVRERWLNLNGLWDYAITPLATAAPAGQAYDGKIRVPYAVESTLSGVGRSLAPNQRLWYHRTFEIPADWRGARVAVHFGAVDYECQLYVNGAPAGSHRGGFDPFSFDITDLLKPQGPQELVLAVTDPSSEGDQPRGKQRLNQTGIWYTPASGIWQTAWLEPLPAENAIAEIRATPDVDAGSVRVAVLGTVPVAAQVHAFRVQVLDGGKVVAEASHRIDREVTISIPQPRLWSPHQPHLYDLRVELFRVKNPVPAGPPRMGYFGAAEKNAFAQIPADAVPLDSVKSYFAMRKVSLMPGAHGPVFALNNQPLFHVGTLDQGYWPDGLLTPPSEAGMRHDVDFLKRAGFNMLRKHIKVEPALYYAHCDRIGLLVWQDMPSAMRVLTTPPPGTDSQHVRRDDQGFIIKRSDAATQYELELRRMIDTLRHHPSIVMWVPFNEGWGQYDTTRIAAAVKALDPTRLVNAVSGWTDVPGAGDVFDVHTYREKLEIARSPDAGRALVVGEFGGLGLPVSDHLWWTDKRNWGYQTYKTPAELTAQYVNRFDQIVAAKRELGVCASIYTQTTDVEGEVNGLLTYDRRVEKIPAAELAKIHAKVFAN
ncbi:MAG: glycoside hydrolase family 2 TIM barrel-domain containing protein [Opitutaceae bacterium]|nr:glycoside hydrolase family 2 TIM barrel-domain containing protein [Opitutaceae bacterium]